MRKKPLRSQGGFAISVLLLLVAAPCMAATADGSNNSASSAKSAQDISREADEYLLAKMKTTQFSGTVLLSRDGKTIFAKGYGYANAEWKIPNSPQTKFRLGSITKQFTATLIMQLQEQGKVATTDPICKYLSSCPETWAPITIHHLLSHTAGVPSYTDDPGFRMSQASFKTHEQVLATFRDKPLDFAPGERFKYSNSGYYLLGMVVEKATGKSYESVLIERILTPLGMKASGYDRGATIIPMRAAGYRPGANGELENADPVDMSGPFAAGAMYSTVEDLERWNAALYTNAVLPQAVLEKMWVDVKGGYGYGWMVSSTAPQTLNRRTVMHGGSINGFQTMIVRYPEQKVAVILLSNNVATSAALIARDLGAIVFGEKYTVPRERREVQLDPKLLSRYVGQYRISPMAILSITVNDGQVFGQVTGQRKLPVFAESELEFFSKAVDAQFTFVKDDVNNITQLVLHQGGRDITAPKIASTVVERKEVAIDAQVLDRYVGEYQLAPNMIVTVSVGDSGLFAQLTGQPRAQIYPETDNKFFYKSVDAQITFVRDANGAVTELVLHQGRDMTAKKIR